MGLIARFPALREWVSTGRSSNKEGGCAVREFSSEHRITLPRSLAGRSPGSLDGASVNLA